MAKTNWSRCSKLLFVGLVLLTAMAAPAAAVSVVEEDVPTEGEVETQVSAEVTLNQLYRSPSLETWQLEGNTSLDDVSWTVVYYDQTGAKVGQDQFTGQTFTTEAISAADGTSEVVVQVTGTVPEVDEYRYDPPQATDLITLEQTQSGGASDDIDSWTLRPYTADSDAARTAVDEAQTTIQTSSADTSKAETTFNQAVNAFEGGEFDLATELADQATSEARSAQQSSQTLQLVLYGVGGLVLVGVVAGGFFWYRSQQDTYDKLG
ncbi:MAG: hypothetical protein ACQETI_04560 [Halobacteriota archaeon]